MTFNAFPDIPMMDPFDIKKFIPNNDFHMSAKEYFSDNVIIDLTSATDLEKGTVLQGEYSEWILERQYRITASDFGKILYCKQRPSESMLKNLFTYRDLSNVKAIAHGKSQEKVARTIYSKENNAER